MNPKQFEQITQTDPSLLTRSDHESYLQHLNTGNEQPQQIGEYEIQINTRYPSAIIKDRRELLEKIYQSNQL
jgi:hypothetical protein